MTGDSNLTEPLNLEPFYVCTMIFEILSKVFRAEPNPDNSSTCSLFLFSALHLERTTLIVERSLRSLRGLRNIIQEPVRNKKLKRAGNGGLTL